MLQRCRQKSQNPFKADPPEIPHLRAVGLRAEVVEEVFQRCFGPRPLAPQVQDTSASVENQTCLGPDRSTCSAHSSSSILGQNVSVSAGRFAQSIKVEEKSILQTSLESIHQS